MLNFTLLLLSLLDFKLALYYEISVRLIGGNLSQDSPYTAQSVQEKSIVLWLGGRLAPLPPPEECSQGLQLIGCDALFAKMIKAHLIAPYAVRESTDSSRTTRFSHTVRSPLDYAEIRVVGETQQTRSTTSVLQKLLML